MAIDFDHLRRFVGDDDALLAEVFGLFTEQTSLWLRALDPDADDETWVSVCHALKGSARTLGAADLGEHCARAEALVGGGMSVRRAALVERIEIAVDAITDEIKRWTYTQQRRAMKAGRLAG